MACGQALDEPVEQPAVREPDADATSSALPPVEAPPEEDVELVTCSRCGSSNAARRRRCGRCGRSLADERTPRRPALQESSSTTAPAPAPARGMEWDDDPTDPPLPIGSPTPTDPPLPAEEPPRRRRRGVAVLVVGLGMVLGTALGVAAGTGVGPFATVEPVAFDPTAYPRDPAALEPATTGSSSTAPAADGRSFGPEATVDGDLTTAWRPDEEATGARLRHGFVTPVWVARIEVATGDQAAPDTFAGAGRVTEARIDLGTQVVEVDIADRDGFQVVPLPDPVLVDQATWEVTGVAGDGAAVSEVRYVGWPADEADREAFRARG